MCRPRCRSTTSSRCAVSAAASAEGDTSDVSVEERAATLALLGDACFRASRRRRSESNCTPSTTVDAAALSLSSGSETGRRPASVLSGWRHRDTK
eukprot:CAMPEP_0175901926 /NCGR_PEP_ID=MMETSP0108-20121206/3122_1 /TAXON_ID=195067 ORGANISM="Goniomonas pacifica, Strain CCMP1869" /NCGR_SAMPLE_ID=MMETSP0108 /ASSEMBLY_ACC=CAM_ASM_000204 /LENGTH=94 /DNA_ID=CAMNT_0017223541 /DNA_START=210 /DNA_END=494 /DNA_ORIENTATION=+